MNKSLNNGYSKGYYIYLLLFLGMMSAFGPFVTDMYLPSLPAMTVEFNTSSSSVQGGITASLIGLAVGQILFGPFSDKWGRKPTMFVSLGLFCLGTVCDIYSVNIQWFNFFRFFQGIGGAGCIVLSRSVATDCYGGRELAKTMAIIGAINGVAPVTAPIIGGFIARWHGWQGVFWTLLGLGLFLFLFALPFRESLAHERRVQGMFSQAFANFKALLRSAPFMKCILVFALANGVLFGYISSAPFICQDYFGYSDTAFSIIFAVNATAIVGGSALSIRFGKLEYSIMVGGIIISILSVVLLLNALLVENFWIYECSVWLMLSGLGLVFPAVTTIAMNRGRQAIGAASAIVGSSGFIAGGIVSPLCGLGNMLTCSTIILLVCGALMLFFLKKIG